MAPRIRILSLLFLRITSAALCHGFCPAAAQTARDEVHWQADSQSSDGRTWRYLRGHVEIRKEQMVLRADEVDYNEETGDAEARGNIHFSHPGRGENVYAARFTYNLNTEEGFFYQTHGTVSSASQASPRVLTTTEPFYFQGEMAHKIKNHYVVYRGYVTNCKRPAPWWTLTTPRATIVPGSHAVLHRSVFRLKKVPLFYAPVYYKSLERVPRSSGFLTPNIGNSSRRGRVLGESFFWAINRSYDVTLGGTYFSQRGFAHQLTARGRPTRTSYFDAFWFAMNDRGLVLGEGEYQRRLKQGGRMFSLNGRAELPWGFYGVASINYLSSLEFRLAFTETYNEAIFSEVHSVGFVTKAFSSFFINAALVRNENFQSTTRDDTIVIRKLPSLEFNSREHELLKGPLPVWLALDSSFDLLGRRQAGFRTRQLAERLDFFPRLSTRLDWKGFVLVPTFGLRETYYGEQLRADGTVSGENFRRSAREFTLELSPPPLARVFDGPRLFADRLKHVIEPKITYRHVAGVPDFDRVIRFDERDLLNNTSEAEVSLINRFFGKREASGEVRELLSVELWQRRYFDPDFGGALVSGSRNVFLSTVDLTPFAFADTPRRYSPLVSVLRVSPYHNYTVEWRNDYDQLRGKLVNSGVAADANWENFSLSLGHYAVRSARLLSPSSNQLRAMARYGSVNKRGWNVGFNVVYDYRLAIMQYANTQVTYNTDCCGFSVEWRRFALGLTRNENQFRLALTVANVGSFGTLKKQERMF
jgi:LPS-assembly protein